MEVDEGEQKSDYVEVNVEEDDHADGSVGDEADYGKESDDEEDYVE